MLKSVMFYVTGEVKYIMWSVELSSSYVLKKFVVPDSGNFVTRRIRFIGCGSKRPERGLFPLTNAPTPLPSPASSAIVCALMLPLCVLKLAICVTAALVVRRIAMPYIKICHQSERCYGLHIFYSSVYDVVP
jgi:hypothetical protein